jgi:GT2 family glycosyltransferase
LGLHMNALPKISVIIPHYNDLEGLDRCLALFGAQTYPKDDFEVVVGDNGSPQGEAAVAKVIAGRARLAVATERGAGPARNSAVAISKGEILAFTDSDCQPDPDWLAQGLAALAGYDFVGGRVRVLVDDPRRMTGVEAFERVFAFDFKTYVTKKGFTGSGNLLCSRKVFDAVGGFRTGVSEDVEWSQRATAAGFRLGYAPKAIVGHPARRTWIELISKWRRVNSESRLLLAEKKGGRARWILRNLAMPASAVVHSPKVMMSGELETFGQRMAAVGVLFRLRMWRCIDALRPFDSKVGR